MTNEIEELEALCADAITAYAGRNETAEALTKAIQILLQSLKDKDAEIERFNALSVLRWDEVETSLEEHPTHFYPLPPAPEEGY